MRIATILILLIWLCSGLPVVCAQQTAAEADLISYDLYQRAQWRQLARYGKAATSAGFDFYYLNLRTGIAAFKLGKWREAEKWLLRAIAQYTEDAVAREYLYWVYLEMGRPIEAARALALLPDEAKKRIGDDPRKLLETVLLEGGARLTNKPDTAHTFQYYGVGMGHRLSPALRFYHAYSQMEQDFFWGSLRQQQYYLAPTIFFKKGWWLAGGANLARYKSNFDYLDATAQYHDTVTFQSAAFKREIIYGSDYMVSYKGKLNLDAAYAHLAVGKTFGNARFSIQIARYGERSKLTFDEIVDSSAVTDYYFNDVLDSTNTQAGSQVATFGRDSAYSQYQAGFSASYTLPLGKGRFVAAGTELQAIFGDGRHWHLIPFFQCQFHRKISIGGHYFRKGNYPFSAFNGGLLINNYDRYFHRLSLTGKFQPSLKLGCYLTYQWESLEGNFLAGKYTGKGLFAGWVYIF